MRAKFLLCAIALAIFVCAAPVSAEEDCNLFLNCSTCMVRSEKSELCGFALLTLTFDYLRLKEH